MLSCGNRWMNVKAKTMNKNKVSIEVYPIGTTVYVVCSKEVVKAEVEKIEINEFDYPNYGVKAENRKSLIWLTEDEVFIDFEEFVLHLRNKFNKK